MKEAARLAISTAAGLILIGPAFAESPVSGTYSGHSVPDRPGARQQQTLTLAIEGAQGDAVKAKANLSGGRCTGEYTMAGKLEGEELRLRSTEAGRLEDCKLSLKLKAQGNKLEGTTGSGNKVLLSK
jgi:hypothetical protein